MAKKSEQATKLVLKVVTGQKADGTMSTAQRTIANVNPALADEDLLSIGTKLGKVAHRAVARAVGAQDALRRRGDEEILLADAQGLALDVVVRRVEHLRDDLGHRALLETLPQLL